MREAKMIQNVKASLDALCVLSAVIISFWLKYDMRWFRQFKLQYQIAYTLIFITGYLILKLQKKSWGQTTATDVLTMISLNLLVTILFFLGVVATSSDFPEQILVIIFLVSTSLLLSVRFIFKMKNHIQGSVIDYAKHKRALVIGAGSAAEILIRERKKNSNFKYNVVGLLDDDPQKQGVSYYGCEVIGNLDSIKDMVKRYDVEVLILAIPSAGRKVIKNISAVANDLDLEYKILPSISDILIGESLSKQIREVKIEDLLGRDVVNTDAEHMYHFIEGKTVFITGGAGSIGSELSRQIAKYHPQKVVIIDVDENSLYFLELELKDRYHHLEIISEVCNVREREKVEWLFEKYQPELVFHAAAHKHVPQMEHNPEEAIKNNIFGTRNIADSAEKYGVDRFVLVSTDKAVNPTNIMGATKRACEMIIQEKNKKGKTRFMAVRFGNVLGSNGSVIPVFKKLIEQGKNLTLTHPEITRYFMTIPEAAQLVVEAGSLGSGGEVFILDMGEPIKILDLAKNLIELSHADVGIDIVGLRPGEKLYEELLYDVRTAEKTENRKIFIAKLKQDNVDVDKSLKKLEKLVKAKKYSELRDEMKAFVSTYEEPRHHFE